MSRLRFTVILLILAFHCYQSFSQDIEWNRHDLSPFKTRQVLDSSFWNQKLFVTTDFMENGQVTRSITTLNDSIVKKTNWIRSADHSIEKITSYLKGQVIYLGIREYDNQGRLIEERKIHETYQFNGDKKISNFDTATYDLFVYDYDKDLLLSKEVFFVWDGDKSLSRTEYYEYDKQNRLIETTVFRESTYLGSFKRNSDAIDTLKPIPPNDYTSYLIQYQKDTIHHFIQRAHAKKELSSYQLTNEEGRIQRWVYLASDLTENTIYNYEYNTKGNLTYYKRTIIDLDKVEHDFIATDEVRITYGSNGLPKELIEFSEGKITSKKIFRYTK